MISKVRYNKSRKILIGKESTSNFREPPPQAADCKRENATDKKSTLKDGVHLWKTIVGKENEWDKFEYDETGGTGREQMGPWNRPSRVLTVQLSALIGVGTKIREFWNKMPYQVYMVTRDK